MKNISFKLTIVVSAFVLVGNRAHATPEVGFDFSQSSNTIEINTQTSAAPNVLRTVTIVCPQAGHTVATANTRFLFNVANTTFFGTVAYSLTRGSTSFQSDHEHSVFGNYVGSFHVFPATIQRIDSCTEGQSVTYRFLATRGSNVFGMTARQPNLVVVYYRDRL